MGLGWLDGMVIIGRRQSKSTFCANKSIPAGKAFYGVEMKTSKENLMQAKFTSDYKVTDWKDAKKDCQNLAIVFSVVDVVHLV